MGTEKTFTVNFNATIDRKGRNTQTGAEVVAPQPIGEFVNETLLRLRTFSEVAEMKQLRGKVKQGGEQTLTESEFATVYKTLLMMNSDEKEQALTVFSKMGIDILEYEVANGK